MFAAAFAVVGTVFLVRSFAAISPKPKVAEAESYANASSVTVVNDASASATAYSQFDTVPVVPPPSPPGGGSAFCNALPSMPSVKPDATNTGVPTGITLAASGSISVTVNGTVIDSKDVNGDVYVNANNVTIKNSKIHSSGGSATMGIRIADGKTGTKILDSEIYTNNGGYEGILGGDLIACGNYIHGWENGMTIGGNSIVQANYFDKLAGGQASPHFDGIEVYFGGNITLWGNNIRMTDTSNNWLGDTGAINVTAWSGNIATVDIKGNWLGGGSYTVYVDEQNGSQATNVTITDNKWYRGSAQYGTHLIRDNSSVVTWSGNVYEDNGQVIAK